MCMRLAAFLKNDMRDNSQKLLKKPMGAPSNSFYYWKKISNRFVMLQFTVIVTFVFSNVLKFALQTFTAHLGESVGVHLPISISLQSLRITSYHRSCVIIVC